MILICELIYIFSFIFAAVGFIFKKKKIILLAVIILTLLSLSLISSLGYVLYKMDQEERSRKVGKYAITENITLINIL